MGIITVGIAARGDELRRGEASQVRLDRAEMTGCASHLKAERSQLGPWLEPLRFQYPPDCIFLIGAGAGNGRWIELLRRWQAPRAILVEADPAQFQQLWRNAADGWILHNEVVAERTELAPYYYASMRSESGLLDPETLRGVWRNLSLVQKQERQAATLSEIHQRSGLKGAAHWLILDCLPSLPILQGGLEVLDKVDVIIVRSILTPLTDMPPNAPTEISDELDEYLCVLGYRLLAIEESHHPAIGHKLYTRDYKEKAAAIANQLTALTEDRDAGALLADELRKALTRADERTAALTMQLKEANKALDEERRQISGLIVARAQVQNSAEEVKTQFEEMRRERDAHARLAEELQLQLADLRTQLASAREAASSAALTTLVASVKNGTEAIRELRDLLQAAVQNSLLPLEKNSHTLLDALRSLSEVTEARGKDEANKQEDARTRLTATFRKDLANAVRQLESFVSIQHHLNDQDTLTDFHGWSISPDMGVFLVNKMRRERYDLIIEFGSGTSTALLCKTARSLKVGEAQRNPLSPPSMTRIVSFEHNKLYYDRTRMMLSDLGAEQEVDLHYAPLVPWRDAENEYLYYDCERDIGALADAYKTESIRILLIVDGPPMTTCKNARYPAAPIVLAHLGLHHIDFVLDDADRPEEKAVIDLWRKFCKARGIAMNGQSIQAEKGLFHWSNG